MDLESIKLDVEILLRIIAQWQRTGRLGGVERAFLLDKLMEIREAVEMQSEECKPQNDETAPGSEVVALEGSEISDTEEVFESLVVAEIVEALGISGATEIPGTSEISDAAETTEPTPEEQPEVETGIRRGRLDRKAIRSLYDDAPEERAAAAEESIQEEVTAENICSQDAPAEDRKDQIAETAPAPYAPVENPKRPVIEDEANQVPHRTNSGPHKNFTAHKKIVLGEVINQRSRTVGDTIAPQVKKKIGAEKISDLKKAIGVNDRYLIMRDLFDGDAGAFDEAMGRLNDFDDINDAMLFIHDTYQWDHDSDGAKLMVDIVVRKLM